MNGFLNTYFVISLAHKVWIIATHFFLNHILVGGIEDTIHGYDMHEWPYTTLVLGHKGVMTDGIPHHIRLALEFCLFFRI